MDILYQRRRSHAKAQVWSTVQYCRLCISMLSWFVVISEMVKCNVLLTPIRVAYLWNNVGVILYVRFLLCHGLVKAIARSVSSHSAVW